MNYLSHQYVAQRAVAEGFVSASEATSAFFVGNVLPDLVGASGAGRLRIASVAASDSAMARGARLHLATDKQFHGHPVFAGAMADASALLRAAPLSVPPRRVFFLAHVFVELALDAHLLIGAPDLADALYHAIEVVGVAAIADAAGGSLAHPDAAPLVAASVGRFLRYRFLDEYRKADGLAQALHNISLRAGLAGFATDADQFAVARCFVAYEGRAAEIAPLLLVPPPPALWYNWGENKPTITA